MCVEIMIVTSPLVNCIRQTRRCIDSIMNGTIICVNDGIGDIRRLSIEICGRFQMDLTIRLIRYRITVSLAMAE